MTLLLRQRRFLLTAFGVSFLFLNVVVARQITLGVKPGLQFDPKALHVQPGEQVELTFDNVDEMMHNFVLVKPGTRLEIVEAAIALGADGPGLDYVPQSDKVLASTPVVLPGKKAMARFRAPDQEGKYPYVCTFPGHGFLMHGILFVSREKPEEMARIKKEEVPKEEKSQWEGFVNEGGAIVHRTFMPDSSPAAIAVSLPGGHSYCWDAGQCRFRYAWRGGYMRKNGSFGRWRTLPTIEGQVYHVENEFPFHEKETQSRTGEARACFEGYRLIDGIPEFQYRVGNLKVAEHLVKLPGKSGLLRKFRIKGSDEGVVWKLDPQAGVTYAFDKGTKQGNAWHLTGKEAESFAVRMEEVPAKFPILRLGMNDLAVCYNRKGDLHSGVIGQSWLMKGGKAIIPAQQPHEYPQGAALSFWVKLTDPSRSISGLVSWEKGGGVYYQPDKDAFGFGPAPASGEGKDGGLEAEDAKFKGPSLQKGNGGFAGTGYLDFGTKVGEFVEWEVAVDMAGPHTLSFRYASSGNRPLRLSVDGEEDLLAPPLPFAGTKSWTDWRNQVHKLDLKPGKRKIRLTSVSTAGPNLDRLTVMGPGSGKKEIPDTLSQEPVMDEDWHLVCLSLEEGRAKLYLDGSLHREFAVKAPPSGRIALDSPGRHPRFYLDELRVYGRPLPVEEIQALLAQKEEAAQ